MTFEGWREARDATSATLAEEQAEAARQLARAREGLGALLQEAVRELATTSAPRIPTYRAVPGIGGRPQLTRDHLGDAWGVPVYTAWGWSQRLLLPDGRLVRTAGKVSVIPVQTLFGVWSPKGYWDCTLDTETDPDVTTHMAQQGVMKALTEAPG
jgi:hypothetical protein